MNASKYLAVSVAAFSVAGLFATASASAETDKTPRYTRLNAEGHEVSNTASARCVRDRTTGFVWELKTRDGSVHDASNRYRWGGKGAEQTGKHFFDDWDALVNASNAEKLCGLTHWRVPSIEELQTLVASERREPAINTDYFPHTVPLPYWASSAYERYPEHGQNVHFGNGGAHYYNGYRGERLAVRLVHSHNSK